MLGAQGHSGIGNNSQKMETAKLRLVLSSCTDQHRKTGLYFSFILENTRKVVFRGKFCC